MGFGVAPAAATGDTVDSVQSDAEVYSDDEPDFIVDVEDTEANGSETTVDIDIDPTEEDSGWSWFIPQNEKINWYVLEIEYDEEKLDFEEVVDSEVGEVEVVEESDGKVVLENGYEFGDFFLDPDEAPATLASVEFSVVGEEGSSASITPLDNSKVGWGPDFLKGLPVFQHDVNFKSGAVQIGEGGEEPEPDPDPEPEPEDELDAVNTGGYISFGEDSEDSAIEEGLEFPEEGIKIEAEIADDGTWESTSTEFPTLETSGIEAEVEAVDGLEGEIDRDADFMTAEGELEVDVLGDAFSFEITPTSGESGALSGEADLGEESGTVTLVDNEYTVEDSTGNAIVDGAIGLPVEESGQSWLKLPLEIEFTNADTEPPEEEEGTLVVDVVDEDGEPIEGAGVTADGIDETTDADGQVEVVVEEGSYDLTVDGAVDQTNVEADVTAGETTNVEVSLETPVEEGTLHLEVVDEDGEPIEGASVSGDGIDESTDASGQVEVVVEEGSYDLTVEGEVDSQSITADVVAGEKTVIDIELETPVEEGTLAVEVVDEDGAPIEGASVSGDGIDETTDANGAVEVVVEEGSYDLTVEGEVDSQSVTADVTADETTSVEVSLETPPEEGTLAVEVVDQNGAPIEGASVTAAGIDETTDASGEVEVVVEEGSYDLTVAAADTQQSVATVVVAGETTTEQFEFDLFEPADGLEATNSGGFISFNEDTNDPAAAREEGIDFPEEGIQIEAEVADDGTWESVSTEFPALEPADGLEAQVQTVGGLEGEIDQQNDFMTAEGTLEVSINGNSFSFDIEATSEESGLLSGEADLGEESGSVTLVDNEYTVEDVTNDPIIDGVLGLPIEEPGLNWLELPLEIDFAQEAPKPPAEGTLVVDVVDEDGEPIEGASVTADGIDETTDANGQVEVVVEEGSYDLTVEGEVDSQSVAADVAADETTSVEVSLETPPEEGTLAVEVVDQDGNPIEGASVTADGFEETTDANGEVEVVVEEGNYDLTVAAADTQQSVATVVVAGETTTEQFEFELSSGPEGLTAANSGGYISFNEEDESTAIEEGLEFPEEGIQIEAEIADDGTWESTKAEFPTLTTSGLEAEVTAVNGLEGEINVEEDFMTAEGTLEVDIDGASFSFDISLTSEESGALTGDADLSEDAGSVTLVDNEYTVDDTTGNGIIDSVLGLPITDPGLSWLELPLDIEFQ